MCISDSQQRGVVPGAASREWGTPSSTHPNLPGTGSSLSTLPPWLYRTWVVIDPSSMTIQDVSEVIFFLRISFFLIEIFVNIFFVKIFVYFSIFFFNKRRASPPLPSPAPLTGTAPLAPHAFGLRTLVALQHFSKKP